jgi:hypothetical protein
MELLAEPLDTALRIPADGEIVEFRFDGVVEGGNVHAKLLYAAHVTPT